MPFDGKNLSKVKNWLIPFSALFIILAYLSYVTVSPLLQPLAWAILLAFLSYPMYLFFNVKLFKRAHPNVSATIMTIFIIFVIIAPAIIVGSIMAKEAIDIYARYQALLRTTTFPIGEVLSPELSSKIKDILEEYPRLLEVLQDAARNISLYGFQMARGFLGNTFGLLYSLLIIFIAYFFLVRDGHIILNYIEDIVPLLAEEQKKFMNRGKDTLVGVVYGVTLTSIVQGILGGIGWWMVGLPNPFLFGALTAFMAMIPFVGTPSVWLPGSIYLFMTNEYSNGVILLLWGIFVVSMIDNFLRPKFISDKANISTFLVFIGAFGGLFAWGFLGLFVGPLILSLSVFFLDSYREIWKLSLRSEIIDKRKDLLNSDEFI
ncbi:MAG: AI-2E family transporter [Synergistaceae bacterium]|nr:AI-2E family transporter [Synergistaceae bacterium]